jgi:hypothetical protein
LFDALILQLLPLFDALHFQLLPLFDALTFQLLGYPSTKPGQTIYMTILLSC